MNCFLSLYAGIYGTYYLLIYCFFGFGLEEALEYIQVTSLHTYLPYFFGGPCTDVVLVNHSIVTMVYIDSDNSLRDYICELPTCMRARV